MAPIEGTLRNNPAIAMLAEGDIEQARLFWRDVMGLEEVYHDREIGEAAFRSGGTVFGIYQHSGGSKADHTQLAFQVDDVPRTVEAIRSRGVQFEEYDLENLKTHNGVADMGATGQGAWFKDPGGNIVGILTTSETLVGAIAARPVIEASVL